MGLVDYSSSDDDSHTSPDEHTQPPAKKPRTSAPNPNIPSPSPSLTTSTSVSTSTSLPPLPSSFHNLYATTVRPFTADLPSLHQGRKRLIPHVEGNWPSHIYVEWHPAPAHHEALSSLIRSLQTELKSLLLSAGAGKEEGEGNQQLTSFLTSDLGAPLPLHISLSRPFVLRTEQKDAFRDTLARRISSLGVVPFELCIPQGGLAWFRSAEASRSFLVLRVRAAYVQLGAAKERVNPQLATLLAACNEVVAAQGQPRLYAHSSGGMGVGEEEEEEEDLDGGGVRPVDDAGEGVDGAFHVSIAWSFAEPTDEIRARTAAVFAREEEVREGAMENMRILVDGVKVKIGNVVSDVPLTEKGGKRSGGNRALFGF
ncbi:poly(U)-specific 3'-to-5' RNA exonuclease [Gnomoniopsis smithogilvyi]|uniref:U6 snRNA phosphodiesterase n=1 Tax=Gnomoniopsis smithogilvyi TaxID=1191159 RepID=A0A9W9D2C8_9PEZI|nr:poly(U)-specific 3'-to-5' RNA exonuclease [Gnomoniopsis smithogilvyi]